MEFRPVPPDQVDALWGEFAPILRRCVTRGEWTVDDVRDWLLTDKVQLLGVFDGDTPLAGLVYCLRSYPQMRVFVPLLLAGDGGFQWGGGMLRVIEKIATENGCRKVKFDGRPEWRRVLEPAGYKAVSINYEKAVGS